MSLRESIAKTISKGDLRHNPLEESGADRMGALGMSDALGAAMLRATADHDGPSLIAAAALLAKRIRKPGEQLSFLTHLCAAVVREWFFCQCTACAGRGYTMHEGRVKDVCKICRGERTRRHSDTERCRQLGIDRASYRRWESRFAAAHEALANAVAQVGRDCARQLERGKII
jgi:hypothetical protein